MAKHHEVAMNSRKWLQEKINQINKLIASSIKSQPKDMPSNKLVKFK